MPDTTPPRQVVAGPAPATERLITVPFVTVCVVSFFSFSQNYVIQPILPLWILSLGGNAAIVGFVGAAFSVSSFAIRPIIGRLVDDWNPRGVMAVGTLLLGVTGFAYAIPGLLAVSLTRMVHGVGWAAVNTAGNTMIVALAPPARRGEAGGYYAMMPGIAQAILPALALAILPLLGFAGVFALAGVLGFVATLFIALIALPALDLQIRSGSRGWLERSAIPAMVTESLSSSAFSLFAVFVPLYAGEIDVPLTSLGIYYFAIGATIVVGRGMFGRLSDRIGRGPVIALGGISVIAGIALLWVARDLTLLTLGGFAYAVGAGLVSPTTFALAADRADQTRRGASMATYSMAFQIANGVGGALWGVLITFSGFPAAFATAILAQVLVVILGLRIGDGPARFSRGRRR